MTTENATEPTATATAATAPAAPKLTKSATITLTANGATMAIVAERKADGSAKTYVITTDASKKSARGMTEQHATFEAARAATEKMAAKAEKLGWMRRQARRGFVAKADAFTTLPTAPAAPKAKK
jgi:hypothetical protein